ncbi:hypothetical protein [Chryseobacterium luteum]|uniref:Trimeric autotransporter adhesin YadA-like head domain-containing protein n=1 Tax=Chryseobacterium luteum TaxID=421531 RepID=A0A085ZW62_9FLAO|nr:hypothetical protein [Chryseobacterium luteum]KFF08676.1 hypothetical protein IX38_04335 [Chryseobacterium luteum]
MKKKLLTLAVLSFTGYLINAQVGINTGVPQATLDVVGFPGTKPDGIIAPRLSLTQLTAKTYASAQTGAIVYVTTIDATPSGSTINVTAPGYYYFNGTIWVFITPSDWHTTGNSGITAASGAVGAAISTGDFLGTKDSQNLVIATANSVKGILDIDGTFKGGNNSTSGPYASFVWGSNNTLSNTASSNVILGRGNTVSAQGPNFPGAAIGYNNYLVNGAKAIGNNNGVRLSDGTVQNLNGANALAFGNYNYGLGAAFGNQNYSNGYAIGSGNTVGANNYAFGSANTANATAQSMVFGFSGTVSANDQSVYANKSHIFFGQGNAATTIVGLNMIPTADITTGAAIQMKGIASGANAGCSSLEEGAIRYNVSQHVHEGCNGTNWKALY